MTTLQQPPQSLRSSSTPQQTSPRGRGRGSSRLPTAPQDRSGALYRVQANSSLRLNATTPSHKFYVVINGIGGLATCNIYSMNFDNDGIRMLITHVPHSHHKSFQTYQDAWTSYTSYYTHITTPDEATFMNENCPAESTNLNNPCRRFQEIEGLNFIQPAHSVRAILHYAPRLRTHTAQTPCLPLPHQKTSTSHLLLQRPNIAKSHLAHSITTKETSTPTHSKASMQRKHTASTSTETCSQH
jgi:hypothetical protein